MSVIVTGNSLIERMIGMPWHTLEFWDHLFKFIIAMLLILGGGILVANRPDLQVMVGPLLGLAVGWYFGRNGTKTGNGATP